MRFLILGANGLIGQAVSKQVESKYKWYGTYFNRDPLGLTKLDVTSDNALEALFEETKPDCVINCTNLAGGVDYCESNPDLAKRFHLEANMSLGKLCEIFNSRLMFLSTDYVFDGKKCPYKEDDEKNPLNVYGKLKLAAEDWITQNVRKSTIVRTTNVFRWDPETVTPNYMMGLYNAIKENQQFRAPSFLWGNPTYADDLASAIIELCEKKLDGIFHVVGSSFINRYDWAKQTCQVAGWDTSLVIENSDIPDKIVPRPLKSHLDTSKFRQHCETKLSSVDEAIERFVASIHDE